jgi:hypothetical protein
MDSHSKIETHENANFNETKPLTEAADKWMEGSMDEDAPKRLSLKKRFDKKHSNYSAAKRKEEEQLEANRRLQEMLGGHTFTTINMDSFQKQRRRKVEPIGDVDLKQIQSTFLPSNVEAQTRKGRTKKNKKEDILAHEHHEIIQRNVLDMIAESPDKNSDIKKHEEEESEGGDSTITSDSTPHKRIKVIQSNDSSQSNKFIVESNCLDGCDESTSKSIRLYKPNKNVIFAPHILKNMNHSFNISFGAASDIQTPLKTPQTLSSISDSDSQMSSPAVSAATQKPLKQEPANQDAMKKEERPIDVFLNDWIDATDLPVTNFNVKDASEFLSRRTFGIGVTNVCKGWSKALQSVVSSVSSSKLDQVETSSPE